MLRNAARNLETTSEAARSEPSESVGSEPSEQVGSEPGLTPDHLPALEGLRGVAILAVLVHHFSRGGFKGGLALDLECGWTGVDLFFVLSGFLITRILLAGRTKPNYFSTFYIRRALRIFPLYYVTTILIACILPHLGLIGNQVEPGYLWLLFLYCQNYASESVLALSGSMLGVTWSLCVEEQFYVVWPWVVRRLSLRKLVWLSAAGVVLALGIRCATWIVNPEYTEFFRWAPARLDSPLIGALIAIAWYADRRMRLLARWAPWVLALALAAIAAVAMADGRLHFREPWTRTFGYTAIAFACGALLVLAITSKPSSLYSRLLRRRELRTFGKYSYGLYLLHTLAGGFVGRVSRHVLGESILHLRVLPQLFHYVAAVSVSLLLSIVSWRVLESPFLRLKSRWPA